MIGVFAGSGGVEDLVLVGSGIVVEVVVCEGSELGGLGDDLAYGVGFVAFGFEDVEFGCAAAFVVAVGGGWTGVI